MGLNEGEEPEMKLHLSAKRRVPLLFSFGREYYLWQVLELPVHWMRYRACTSKYHYSDYLIDKDRLTLDEVLMWEKHYLPMTKPDRNTLILDAGAGEGETIVFFAAHGYRNFVAIEPNLVYFEHLSANAKRLGVSVNENTRCSL